MATIRIHISGFTDGDAFTGEIAMSEVGLYLLKLNFNPPAGIVGAGSMTLALTVDASTGALHGQAQGTILEGTQHAPTFTASVSGAMHSTGYGTIVKVGAVSGEAAVSLAPPAIGTYLAPFSASFGLDADWTGQGQFSVGSYSYPSDVTLAE
jgi:hypothetical protein